MLYCEARATPIAYSLIRYSLIRRSQDAGAPSAETVRAADDRGPRHYVRLRSGSMAADEGNHGQAEPEQPQDPRIHRGEGAEVDGEVRDLAQFGRGHALLGVGLKVGERPRLRGREGFRLHASAEVDDHLRLAGRQRDRVDPVGVVVAVDEVDVRNRSRRARALQDVKEARVAGSVPGEVLERRDP